MRPLSIQSYILKRITDDWKLLLSVFFGITIAATLVAGAPVYLQALGRQSLNTAIDRSSQIFLDVFVSAPNIPLNDRGIQDSDQLVDDAIQDNIASVYRGRERYLKAPNYIVGLPDQPLPDRSGAPVRIGPRSIEDFVVQRVLPRGMDPTASQGYFQSLSNIDQHVNFISGRMATDLISDGVDGPTVEAVMGTNSADVFNLKVGDVVVLTPAIGERIRITVNVVGILEPIDPAEEFWQRNANIFFEPQPLGGDPEEDIEIDPEEPPLSLFVTQNTLIAGVGNSYPGTLVSSSWFVFVDKELLKKMSSSELTGDIDGLDNQLAPVLQGGAVFTGIKSLVADFEERNFFSTIPLLLLLVIMTLTVLYYLAMMVGYLVRSREGDIALLRSRGVSTPQLFRLYSMEGLVITVVAVLVAPFLAIGVIALAGKLSYFEEITNGNFLPVELGWQPFAVALGMGALSMAIFVIPGVVGARTGLIIHKLRSSRPPSVPIFQRYYLDVLLLIIGGLVFWELQARGQLISGGLFKDQQVNEALLFAPVLFLVVVALLFMRFFPLFVRYISGESPGLIHLLAAATFIALAVTVVAREVSDDNGLAWVWPVIFIAALALIYWATYYTNRTWKQLLWLAVQSGFVALILLIEPPTSSDESFAPSMSLIALVPVQLLFQIFRLLAQRAPVWVQMGLWHMARNPLQYSWLVLLLVLVTGLGVLATTVGGTLTRSHEERVLYETASDVRVSGAFGFVAADVQTIKERYLAIDGVERVSLGLRGSGNLGTTGSGSRFEVLALESLDFPYISWYRDDFSDAPLTGVMQALRPGASVEPVAIPEGATEIGLWLKPETVFPTTFLWLVLQDRRGVVDTVTLGNLGEPEWHLKRAEIPPNLQHPLQLVSIQIFEPVFGPAGTPGSMLIDDVQTFGPNGAAQIIEDFETGLRWIPLATSRISSDLLNVTQSDVYSGDRSGVFTFGKDTDRGIRGFYQSPSGGPVPVVVDTRFLNATGAQVGDALIVDLFGRFIPVLIKDSVNFFPTMQARDAGFVLVDLDGILRHLNILSPTSNFTPNELFIDEAPLAGEAVRNVVLSIAGASNLVHDRDLLLTSIRLDPFITAGWKVMVLLSLGIIVFTAGLGYITYLLSVAEHSRTEIGFLQSLGLSRGQTIGLISMEHLVIVIIGLGLGSWAGFQMSTLLVSSVAVTETGDKVIPPFVLETDWSFMIPIYIILVGIFLGALFRLNWSLRKVNLQSISRMET